MKVIGITGASGSGKSTLSEILGKEYHAYLINADQVAKEITYRNSPYLNAIAKKLGNEILEEDGGLNRRRLADMIYHDTKKREILNQCTAVHVVNRVKELIKENKEEKWIVLDAPTLFECQAQELCDFIIGLIAEDMYRVERICKRDGIQQEIAQARIQVQISDEFLKQNCDAIIYNNDNEQEMKTQLTKIMKNIERQER